MKRIDFTVDEELYNWLEFFCKTRKLSKTKAMRRILTVYKLALQKRIEREAKEKRETKA